VIDGAGRADSDLLAIATGALPSAVTTARASTVVAGCFAREGRALDGAFRPVAPAAECLDGPATLTDLAEPRADAPSEPPPSAFATPSTCGPANPNPSKKAAAPTRTPQLTTDTETPRFASFSHLVIQLREDCVLAE